MGRTFSSGKKLFFFGVCSYKDRLSASLGDYSRRLALWPRVSGSDQSSTILSSDILPPSSFKRLF